jgi:hypothetical protein
MHKPELNVPLAAYGLSGVAALITSGQALTCPSHTAAQARSVSH